MDVKRCRSQTAQLLDERTPLRRTTGCVRAARWHDPVGFNTEALLRNSCCSVWWCGLERFATDLRGDERKCISFVFGRVRTEAPVQILRALISAVGFWEAKSLHEIATYQLQKKTNKKKNRTFASFLQHDYSSQMLFVIKFFFGYQQQIWFLSGTSVQAKENHRKHLCRCSSPYLPGVGD